MPGSPFSPVSPPLLEIREAGERREGSGKRPRGLRLSRRPATGTISPKEGFVGFGGDLTKRQCAFYQVQAEEILHALSFLLLNK